MARSKFFVESPSNTENSKLGTDSVYKSQAANENYTQNELLSQGQVPAGWKKGAINIGSDIAQKPILLKNTNNDKVHTIELEGLASAKLDTTSAPNGVLAAEKAEPVSSTINTSSLQSQANAKNSSVNEIKSQTSLSQKKIII